MKAVSLAAFLAASAFALAPAATSAQVIEVGPGSVGTMAIITAVMLIMPRSLNIAWLRTAAAAMPKSITRPVTVTPRITDQSQPPGNCSACKVARRRAALSFLPQP